MSFFDTGTRIVTQPGILAQVFHMDELRCSNGLRFLPFLFKAATSFSLIVRLFKYPG